MASGGRFQHRVSGMPRGKTLQFHHGVNILALKFLLAELWESWQQVFGDREKWFMWFIKENQRGFPGLRLLFGRPEEQLVDQQQ